MPVVLAYLACVLIWSTTWYAIRVTIGPEGFPVFLSVALRFSLAALALVPLLGLRTIRPGPRGRGQWLWLAAAGLLNAGNYVLVYAGEQYISGGLTAVLYALSPLLTAFLVTITRTERVARGQLMGALAALLGISAIFADRAAVSAAQAFGVGLVLLGVICTSLAGLVIKRHAQTVHPVASTALFMAVTAAAAWLAVVASGEPLASWPPPGQATLAVVYLALLGSVVAFACWFYLLRRISLMSVSMLTLLTPVIALIVDALWEREIVLAGRTYAGIGITLAGVFAALRVGQKRQVPGQDGS